MVQKGLLPHVELTAASIPPLSPIFRVFADFHTAAERIETRATHALERLLINFFVAGGEEGYYGGTVVLYVLDDAACYLWVYATSTRFERHARTIIVSDNGPELLSHTLRDCFIATGVEHTFSVALEKMNNGAVERTIKKATQMARHSLAAAALPAQLWPFAVRGCTFLLNRMPHAAHDRLFSPYAALYNRNPRYRYQNLLPLSVLIYFKVLPTPPKVLENQLSLGVFLVFTLE
jgi:hypothetical protein